MQLNCYRDVIAYFPKGLLSCPKLMHVQTLVKAECVCCTQGTLLRLVAILEVI